MDSVAESIDWVETWLVESVCADEASDGGANSVEEDEPESGPEGRDVLDSEG